MRFLASACSLAHRDTAMVAPVRARPQAPPIRPIRLGAPPRATVSADLPMPDPRADLSVLNPEACFPALVIAGPRPSSVLPLLVARARCKTTSSRTLANDEDIPEAM